DATRQMPWVTAGLTYSRPIGYANYHALESRLQKQFANGLYSLVSYTWGKSTDVGSGYFNVENGPGGGSTIQNYYDQSTARGVSSYDIKHFVSWATIYELPFGRGKSWLHGGPLSWVLGNWQANYIFQARSGAPYNLQVSGDVANLRGSAPGGPGTYARPNLIGNIPRSEEHTSELQSRGHLVCRLLLEKKKNNKQMISALLRKTYKLNDM